jgi:hypothetical protein
MIVYGCFSALYLVSNLCFTAGSRTAVQNCHAATRHRRSIICIPKVYVYGINCMSTYCPLCERIWRFLCQSVNLKIQHCLLGYFGISLVLRLMLSGSQHARLFQKLESMGISCLLQGLLVFFPNVWPIQKFHMYTWKTWKSNNKLDLIIRAYGALALTSKTDIEDNGQNSLYSLEKFGQNFCNSSITIPRTNCFSRSSAGVS